MGPALIQMGDWCGSFWSDAKDDDITGAMFVTMMDEVKDLCCYRQR